MVMGSPGISEVQIINLTDYSMEGLSIKSELFTSPLSGSHHSIELLPGFQQQEQRGEETAMARWCSLGQLPAQAKKAALQVIAAGEQEENERRELNLDLALQILHL